MKKNMIKLLICAICVSSINLPAYASEISVANKNASIRGCILSAGVYAFPERPSGRVEETNFKVSNKGQKITLSSLTSSLSIYLASVGILSGAIVAGIATNIIGSIDGTEAYIGEKITEYYVYDFEGSVIGYKYYIDVAVYEDSSYKKGIDSYSVVREAVSPLSEKEIY